MFAGAAVKDAGASDPNASGASGAPAVAAVGRGAVTTKAKTKAGEQGEDKGKIKGSEMSEEKKNYLDLLRRAERLKSKISSENSRAHQILNEIDASEVGSKFFWAKNNSKGDQMI